MERLSKRKRTSNLGDAESGDLEEDDGPNGFGICKRSFCWHNSMYASLATLRTRDYGCLVVVEVGFFVLEQLGFPVNVLGSCTL